MPKITFIGAGSMVFAKRLIGDVLSYPELSDSTISLMDIDESRLENTRRVTQAMIDSGDVSATVEATTDRREALTGADYVLNMINVGGTEPFENEIRIPEKYGIGQAIGDTLGPGGVFRGLRTIPVMLDIVADMEECCPDALLMNYTNPMAILCWTVTEASSIETIGLCHSVPHTADAIAEYVGLDHGDIDHWVAGINHLAWFLQCEADGNDLYPELNEAMEDPSIYKRDTVRFELLEHFGYFPTESSHHISEYLPYFRTDEDEIERLSGTGAAKRMPTATYLEGWLARSEERDNTVDEIEDPEIERSEEYAARLIHSLETGIPRRFNLNVPNHDNLITNLPTDSCVEVPCLVDSEGIHPCAIGDLPPQLASLCRSNIAVQERAVTGALEGDRTAIHQSIKLDPLSAASCTMAELHEMTEELLTANEAYIPELN